MLIHADKIKVTSLLPFVTTNLLRNMIFLVRLCVFWLRVSILC